ncbi:hypothetical protein UlMin_011211 [Ulmus minor]
MLPKISFTFLVLMGIIAITLSTTLPTISYQEYNPNELPLPIKIKPGTGRFLAQQVRTTPTQTCDKFPRVCRAKGSSGPDCCSKQCVDVSKDKLNCGKCGKKCKYSEICCQGNCVNSSVDKKHCGRCNNSCGRGNSCSFGLCSYA